jgi:hypothetical protein
VRGALLLPLRFRKRLAHQRALVAWRTHARVRARRWCSRPSVRVASAHGAGRERASTARRCEHECSNRVRACPECVRSRALAQACAEGTHASAQRCTCASADSSARACANTWVARLHTLVSQHTCKQRAVGTHHTTISPAPRSTPRR